MVRRFCWLVLLCACGSTAPTPPGGDTQETQGEEQPVAASAESSAPESPFLFGMEELGYVADTFVERERYAEYVQRREAYGDGDECEGVCGLSISPEPEPELLDSADAVRLGETLTQLAEAAEAQQGDAWATLATRLRELAAEVRGADGEDEELAGPMSVVVDGALGAFVDLLTSGSPSAELCQIGTRVVAADVSSLRMEVNRAVEGLIFQMQIDQGMGEDTRAIEDELDEQDVVMQRADPLSARVASLLGEEPVETSVVMPELEQLYVLVEGMLDTRLLSAFRTRSDAWSRVCAF